MLFLKYNCIVLFLAGVVSINAMERSSLRACEAIQEKTSDFQIYQFLSEATKNNLQLYLPDDVTRIIVTNTCELTKNLHAECYKKYGACLYNPTDLLNFLVNKSMNQATIVAILKACLSHSGKSLNQIQYGHQQTALHCLMYMNPCERLEPLKILPLAAEDKAWNLITMQNSTGYTLLRITLCGSKFN